jgi:hypothetical protein
MGAIYCFCFASNRLPADLDFAPGGWEDPVYISQGAGLSAVLAEVPRTRFAGADAEQRLADLEWLLPRLQAHDRVISLAMACATVFPLRFGTLFSSPQVLAGEVAHRRRTLLDFFARMAGREEWAVKALLDQDRALAAQQQALFPDDPKAPPGPPSGRDYLLRQRRKVEAGQAIGPWLNGVVADLDQRLLDHCESVLTRPAHEPAVANRACLVGTGGAAALRAAVARMGADYAPQGLELHCSGPWPLYSFCSAPGPAP